MIFCHLLHVIKYFRNRNFIHLMRSNFVFESHKWAKVDRFFNLMGIFKVPPCPVLLPFYSVPSASLCTVPAATLPADLPLHTMYYVRFTLNLDSVFSDKSRDDVPSVKVCVNIIFSHKQCVIHFFNKKSSQ